MSESWSLGECAFTTDRFRVAPWHTAERVTGPDLAATVAAMLTERTTGGLPEPWRGTFTAERARAWIAERDAESPTLLVTERASGRHLGLVILAEVPVDESMLDVRLGYVVAEDAWGRGVASEVVSGLVAWARSEPRIRTLTGGVELTNRASIRVLEKHGFEQLGTDGDSATYRLEIVG